MKNLSAVYLIASSFLLSSLSCTNDISLKEQGLELKLVVHDENRIEGVDFNEGTDILLCIIAINNSKQEIRFPYPARCEYYKHDDFLKIYKWVQFEDSGEKQLVPYGKSYYPHPCPDINLYITISPGEEKCLLGGSWNEDSSNPPLSKGRYYSSFNIYLPIEGGSKQDNLEVEFEIK